MKLTEMGSIPATHGKDFVELYSDYLWEVYQRKIIHMPWGFACYGVYENYVFISDVYIDPKSRERGIPRQLLIELEKMAKSIGRFYIGTKVNTLDKAWESNLGICEHLGFGRAKVTPEYIFLMKRRDD